MSGYKILNEEKVIKNDVVLYLSSIILCLKERFGELTGDGENVEVDTRIVDRDKILHNICHVCDIHNCVLPDGIPVNNDNVVIFVRAHLESIEILVICFEEVFLKIDSNANLDIMKKEYISMLIYSHLNPLVSDQDNFGSSFFFRQTLNMKLSIAPSGVVLMCTLL